MTCIPTPPRRLRPVPTARVPYGKCAVVGLGLFAGVTGPLLSAFVPLLVQAAIRERRAAIGAVMSIDNVLLTAPGAVGRRRLGIARALAAAAVSAIVLGGFVLASVGMALFATPVVTAAPPD